MNNRALAARLRLFIDAKLNVISFRNGDHADASEQIMRNAQELIELAQPLLDKLQTLIAEEGSVSPGI